LKDFINVRQFCCLSEVVRAHIFAGQFCVNLRDPTAPRLRRTGLREIIP